MNDWQLQRHEISTRRCATVRSVGWIAMEVRNPPVYDGFSHLHDLLSTMERTVA